MKKEAGGKYVLYFREQKEKEGYSNLGLSVEQLKKECNEMEQRKFTKISVKDGELVVYVGEDGEVYIHDEGELIVEEVQGVIENVLELTINPDK